MQKSAYIKGTSNHEEHDKNPLYWSVLLKDLNDETSLKDKIALDFGCGKGRNVTNMFNVCSFKRVDGVDISEANIEYCKLNYTEQNSSWYVNDGVSLDSLPSNEYDFVMSTIVFQHICVYSIRMSLFREIYRVMNKGGIFSFQMGFDKKKTEGTRTTVGYFDNFWDAPNTNSNCDTRVEDPNDLVKDLESIGFNNISYEIHPSFSDRIHAEWIYVRAEK